MPVQRPPKFRTERNSSRSRPAADGDGALEGRGARRQASELTADDGVMILIYVLSTLGIREENQFIVFLWYCEMLPSPLSPAARPSCSWGRIRSSP